MAEGKTITIIQKGKKEDLLTVTLNFHAFMGYQTCYYVMITLNDKTWDQIKATSFGNYVETYKIPDIRFGDKLQLTGQAHYCEQECTDAQGNRVSCYDALESNHTIARFDDLTYWNNIIEKSRDVKVTWG